MLFVDDRDLADLFREHQRRKPGRAQEQRE